MAERPYERIEKELNEAAGLPGGRDKDFRALGITCGYIGNVERDGRDDRAWGFFRPHPDASDRMIGRYPDLAALLNAYYDNPARFIEWAKGAES